MRSRLLSLAFLFLSTEAFAVIGGQPVRPTDPVAASTVSVLMGAGGGCTGTLIERDVVVTAAHCFHANPSAGDIEIVFGMKEEEGVRIGAADFRVNVFHRLDKDPINIDRFRKKEANDIALILLRSPAPTGFEPAKILPDSSVLRKGQMVTVAGYGRIDPEHPVTERMLRKASIRVRRQLSPSEIVLDFTQGSGTCVGDSGGPGFLEANGELFLYGVIATGDPYCAIYEVHTRVDSHRDWIQKRIADMRESQP